MIITVDGKPFAQIGPLEVNKASGMEYLISSGLLNEPTSQGESKNLTYMSFPIDMSLQTTVTTARYSHDCFRAQCIHFSWFM